MKERKKERKNKKLVCCPLWVLKRCVPSLYFEPKPNLSKTLESLLMRLVIVYFGIKTLFCRQIHWILQYSFITCPGQRWMEGKEAVRFCLFVCFFVLPWKINQSRSIWFCRVSVMSGVWNRPRRSVWISMPYGNRNSRSHKSSSSIIGLLSYSAELEIFYIFFVIMWDEYSKKVLSPSSYALLFSKWKGLSTKIQ